MYFNLDQAVRSFLKQSANPSAGPKEQAGHATGISQ
jgi:hypothetical protein